MSWAMMISVLTMSRDRNEQRLVPGSSADEEESNHRMCENDCGEAYPKDEQDVECRCQVNLRGGDRDIFTDTLASSHRPR